MMRKGIITLLICSAFCGIGRTFGQSSQVYKLMIDIPLVDYSENFQSNYRYPSMRQAEAWSSSLNDLSFWGIHSLSNTLIKNNQHKPFLNVAEKGVEYLLGFAWSKYGNELPVPLGIWSHEAFHCSVLGAAELSPKNGNSLLNRWDGTVYGVSDEQLSYLKKENPSQLLYSYVAGVQSEIYSTQENVIKDFFNKRMFYKAPLYLYNAWYVYNYFSFSVSPLSDSVKVIAPKYEDADPVNRDFAGADLTSWIYDMFAPDSPYENRDAFPDGKGVNRRVGVSDLSSDGRSYLERQKKLSMLNFLNPAIFLVPEIRINSEFSFLAFAQYSPTHFGNDIALILPFTKGSTRQMIAFHTYSNASKTFPGIRYQLFDLSPLKNKNLTFGTTVNVWNQPANQSFWDTSGKLGGYFEIALDYDITHNITANITGGYKSEGWMMGVPYLNAQGNWRAGVVLRIPVKES